jgi:hypothetical protein
MLNQYHEILLALKKDEKPLWGKMSPQHMVEHLILAVQMSNGKLIFECFNPAEKIPTLKRFLMSSRPMPKLFVNPIIGEDLRLLKYSSLEEAMGKLKNEIDDYKLFFKNNPDVKPVNATFGELNKEEWDVFHEKHFIHHLNQFGLL